MIGIDAMVITPIPADGMGEVMFEVSRWITRPARARYDNTAISRGPAS
ncbi:MAG: hypothetical protein R2844_19855 [Caldilineales bacterium]